MLQFLRPSCYFKSRSPFCALGTSLYTVLEGSDPMTYISDTYTSYSAPSHLKIGYLLEQIADIKRRIAFKQHRTDTAAAMSNFEACDELSQEISEFKSQKHEKNCFLGPLQKKVA